MVASVWASLRKPFALAMRYAAVSSLVNCNHDFCHITPACRLKGVLQEGVQHFFSELDQHTLADMLKENQKPPLYKLLLVE